jgi:phenylpropionate dioxygenase-like ring-hydroxylating dioxygenase large terminal subunit
MGASRQPGRDWARGVLTHVPYWVYQDDAVQRAEQQRVFEGPVWNYLCLEAEVRDPGDYRATFVGAMPVVVTRDTDGEIYAFENRCAHRGALLVLDDSGHARDIQCVYHAWTYDLRGNLKGVAFQDGVNGKGGMPPSFCLEGRGPRKLRTATVFGLVFGSLSEDVPPLEEYLGEAILARIERVLAKPVTVIGRFTQALPNNWKLYVENVKDSYHASLLHLFFTTFRLNRLTQRGGVIVSDSGGHHVSWSAAGGDAAPGDASYSDQGIRAESGGYRLADPGVLEGRDEFGDGVTLQILSVFPGFVLQQIQNSIAVRQVLPKGVGATDLHWTYLGFADDTPELRRLRLRHGNLVGPAGFVSMEDGAVGGFVQRGIACASGEAAVVQMGGDGAETQEFRATETSVRGFWKAYRALMEI